MGWYLHGPLTLQLQLNASSSLSGTFSRLFPIIEANSDASISPRGQQVGQRSPLLEPQARTPSSISTGRESYFDSLQSPFADNQEPRPPSPRSPPRRSPSGELLASKRPRERLLKDGVDRSHSRRRLEYELTPESSAPAFSPSHVIKMEKGVPFENIRSQAPIGNRSSEWLDDPFSVDKNAAAEYMGLYFRHVNSATYRMFPDAQFLDWVHQPESEKSPEELMVIHSMLAMGSLFCPDEQRQSADGKKLSDMAIRANENRLGRFSLQSAQARLLLSLYYFAKGESSKAWDLYGSACQVIAALKLNVEEEVLKICMDGKSQYGIRGYELAECYRRTYWSAFLMDVGFSWD